MDAAVAEVGARGNDACAARLLTNFFPAYGPANDQVDRVVPVRRAIFQRFIPRYRLSTSETRDQGLGPQFVDSGAYSPPTRGNRSTEAVATRAGAVERGVRGTRPPLPDYAGRRVDIYA